MSELEPAREPAPAGREQCPTCGAPRRGQAVCHRCRSDLTSLIELEQRVDDLVARARWCYANGWYRQAAMLADQIVTLEQSPERLAFLACARLMAGDFPAAVRVYPSVAYHSTTG